jgi:hypothetical protein
MEKGMRKGGGAKERGRRRKGKVKMQQKRIK